MDYLIDDKYVKLIDQDNLPKTCDYQIINKSFHCT